MSRVTYRIATGADHGIVVTLLGELVVELGPPETVQRLQEMLVDDIRGALASPRVRIFLAELDGETVGLGRADVLTTDPIFRLREDHRCGYIDQMFVRPAHRGRGVGAHLLRLCEDWFREQKIAHALLHSAPRATHFYTREGYLPNREMFKRL